MDVDAMGPLEPMEARAVQTLPAGEGWWYEPKWDGFRCLLFREGEGVRLQAKSGKSLSRFFPDLEALARGLPEGRFVLDGEILIETPKGYSFEALQLRLHPSAARVARLAKAAPAELMLFDLLADAEGLRASSPFGERRAALAAFLQRNATPRLRLTVGTCERPLAVSWLSGGFEGVVAKRLDEPYAPGARAMQKVKRLRTADCVVGGYRRLRNGGEVGSLLLGLYGPDGRLHHVGFAAGLAAVDPSDLARRLEALEGGLGFDGKSPGAASRWSNGRSGAYAELRPELVVEVSFDHVSEGRFRHGTRLLRFRDDKDPRRCGLEQIGP